MSLAGSIAVAAVVYLLVAVPTAVVAGRRLRRNQPQETPVTDTAVTQPTPEPLVKAEAVRAVIAAVVAAGWLAPIPDPVLSVVVPVAVTLLGAGVSAALTVIARGKVWALRRGVDVDDVIDVVQSRTR